MVAIERHRDEADKQVEHTVFGGNIRLADWDTAADGHFVERLEVAHYLFGRKDFAQWPDAARYGCHAVVVQYRSRKVMEAEACQGIEKSQTVDSRRLLQHLEGAAHTVPGGLLVAERGKFAVLVECEALELQWSVETMAIEHGWDAEAEENAIDVEVKKVVAALETLSPVLLERSRQYPATAAWNPAQRWHH